MLPSVRTTVAVAASALIGAAAPGPGKSSLRIWCCANPAQRRPALAAHRRGAH